MSRRFTRSWLTWVGSNNYARLLGSHCVTVMSTISARLGIDPVVQLRPSMFGVDEVFAIHLFRRDITGLIEVWVNHVYDRFCDLEPGDIVVDCGAYIGEFTVYASAKVGENGLVLAFEPNPQSLQLCRTNTGNRRNIVLFGTALGKQKGEGFIQVDHANLGATVVSDSRTKDSTAKIAIEQLDRFLPYLAGRSIKLLKIDAEGDAVKILSGGRQLLEERRIKNVSAEVHPGEEDDLQRALERLGFTCFRDRNYLYASTDGLAS